MSATAVRESGSLPTVPSFFAGLPTARAALELAARRHDGQRRGSDQAAFLLHPLEVAWLLHSIGQPDEVVAAGVLHDVLEQTETSPEELREAFGATVAEMVMDLTEYDRIADPVERKAELRRRIEHADTPVAAIFAADKISKVRELRITTACNRGAHDPGDKLEHYKASLSVLERVLGPQHRLVAELRFELEALIALPPS